MANKNKKAFTLVELLAVIVILAVILVIAVPQIMNVIKESRKGALASSAKLIASSAETAYISNQTLGIEKNIRCEDVSSYNSADDFTCDLKFEDGKAKVTLIGKGKFEGMAVCGGTKEEAEVEEPIGGQCPTPFEKDTWATIKSAVDARDTSKYNVGDTKTVDLGELGTHTVRIANKSACPTGASALASETACGFVIEFADIITSYNMNSTATNAGGWPASAMRKYLNDLESNDSTDGVIYNALVAAIGNIIIPTTVVSSHVDGDTTVTLTNNNFKSTDKLYLLSPEEVYGTSFTNSYDTSIGTSRQLDYYATYDNKDGTTGVTTSKYAGAIKQNAGSNAYWWLRSVYGFSIYYFYDVRSNDSWHYGSANNTYGVSPAFRLG